MDCQIHDPGISEAMVSVLHRDQFYDVPVREFRGDFKRNDLVLSTVNDQQIIGVILRSNPTRTGFPFNILA